MKRVLILTAGYGEGHNTAARSLAEAFAHASGGDEVDAQVVDLFEMSYPRTNRIVKKGYAAAINHLPALWSRIYRVVDSTRLFEASLPAFAHAERALARIIATEQPDAVVSTYPVYNFLLDRIRRGRGQHRFLQLTVITDSITVNSVWHRASSDFFVVANDDTAAVVRAAGIPDEKVKVLGFPVSAQFASSAVHRPPPSSEDPPRLLYMINASQHRAPRLVRRLLEIDHIQLTITAGRDDTLRRQLESLVERSGKNAEVLGWSERLPELLMSNHLLVGKAGGAMVQEAIAAGTPMVISQVVPGQEEGNARLILDHNCGAVAEDEDEIVRTVERAFANDGQLWRTWAENIRRLSRPGAASKIAEFIMDEIRCGAVAAR